MINFRFKHSYASPFKLKIVECPVDTSISGRFKAFYCEFRTRHLYAALGKSRLLDLVKKEKQFEGATYPIPTEFRK